MTVKKPWYQAIGDTIVVAIIILCLSFLLWFVLSSIVTPVRILLLVVLLGTGAAAWHYTYQKWPWQ
jgi:hypothetical protein